jgi:hypothetical protein
MLNASLFSLDLFVIHNPLCFWVLLPPGWRRAEQAGKTCGFRYAAFKHQQRYHCQVTLGFTCCRETVSKRSDFQCKFVQSAVGWSCIQGLVRNTLAVLAASRTFAADAVCPAFLKSGEGGSYWLGIQRLLPLASSKEAVDQYTTLFRCWTEHEIELGNTR